MSNTKKNAGCSNCKHYGKGIYGFNGHAYDSCSSGLTIKEKKVNDYEKGIVQVERNYSPKIENKNLTCKGFTLIDWKAKYDEVKHTGLYVETDIYEKVLETNTKLRYKIYKKNNWLISVLSALAVLFIVLLCVILKMVLVP